MQKAIIALVVVFLGFWMFTDPRGLADVASNSGSHLIAGTGQLFDAIIKFIRELN